MNVLDSNISEIEFQHQSTGNSNLHRANELGDDEYYTRFNDISNEVQHYDKHFKNKTVYCNCDDPWVSKFIEYFSLRFEQLGLKKLVATCYKNQDWNLFSQHQDSQGLKIEYNGFRKGERKPRKEDFKISKLNSDGDFLNEECVKILKQADIVVTNPPFSLFRKYVTQLIKYKKKFLIIGNSNATGYKDFFPYVINQKIWMGVSKRGMNFDRPDGTEKSVNATWWTNLTHPKRNEIHDLICTYNEKDYPKYDNFDAIDVSEGNYIPKDYEGVMGIPITFLDRLNPNQFEIVGISKSWWGGDKAIPKSYTSRS